MLSKKYYKEFAEIIGSSDTTTQIQDKLEGYFASDNPRFDVFRFREAVAEAQKKKAREVVE